MLKAGMLPAPVIQPLRYDTSGTRIQVGPNTYIQIRSDVPATRIYFTTDGTKPDPFQISRTGKASTHKYIGPFRLQLGSRVVRAILISRDKLRESAVATRYIDVLASKRDHSATRCSPNDYDRELLNSSSSPTASEDDDEQRAGFMERFGSARRRGANENRQSAADMAEMQASVDGPINPINYSGTQINVWGFPTPELAQFLDNKQQQQQQPNVGYLTDQMIKNLNTPRPIENEKRPPSDSMANLPESLRKLFKQLQKLYERDTDFQAGLDYLVENGQVKGADISETYNSFTISVNCPKFLVDEPPPPPTPKPKPRPKVIKHRERHESPEIEIYDDKKKAKSPSPPPPPPPQPPAPTRRPSVVQPVKKEPPRPVPVPAAPKIEAPPPGVYIEEFQQQGTMIDAPNFKPDKDAADLRDAVKGFGTKEAVIINIMGNRSNAQRMKIKDTYKLMHGRDLVQDLKDDTSGNFSKLLAALLMSPVEYDCMELRKAIQGLGTDDSALIEILTSRSNKRLKDMSQLYTQLYKKKMEDDVTGDTSGAYRKLLSSIMNAGRPETNEVDMGLVQKDTDELIQAGIKKWGTDESKFNVIFGTRSYAHLRKVFDDYQQKTKKSIEDSIKNEMSGNVAKSFLSLISNIRNRPGYFAQQIRKAIKGLGTDEHTLNRIVVSRCEIDTKQIKEEYAKLYSVQMEQDLKGDVSGNYGKLLLMLLVDPSQRLSSSSSASEPTPPDEPHQIEQVEEAKVEETPTLRAAASFNANDDCDRLRKAMKGLGTDEKAIVDVIAKRSNAQRQQLKDTFKQMFGRDLLNDLHSELSGHFRDTIEALMKAPDEFDAWSFKQAIAGLGTDESALVELLVTRSPDEINTIKAKYQTLYGHPLEADIGGDTSGAFKHVLVSLLTALRPVGNTVDRTQARQDAQDLFNAGEKKWLTDKSTFVTILCTRSFPQLRATFDEYEKLTKHSFEAALNKEVSGDLLKVFQAIVACIKDKQAFLATRLFKSMKGFGTKESCLIRVIVSRCEVDMVQVKQKFELLYKAKLADFIKGDTSGDFARTLFTLIDEEMYIKK